MEAYAIYSNGQVKPQFYAFRWITLLLSQEFNFQSILRIWDSLLSNPFGVQDMLLRICCAMLLCMKSRLLSGDFVANLRLLQHYPDINIEYLLQVAQDLSADTSSYSLSLRPHKGSRIHLEVHFFDGIIGLKGLQVRSFQVSLAHSFVKEVLAELHFTKMLMSLIMFFRKSFKLGASIMNHIDAEKTFPMPFLLQSI
ncbi:hypothetical protein NC653_015884 [Populus alba x Populus x berolinensis]|uniref:Rab-GAP TBC domain-containing protein n=1 Tax=Populus alba x Populus x berolinensis TaxID=444605 RepID=A0AAD6QLQ2_9ROSI|nr:hypothetical protein NC653_015884 [Populus alba x Populus x berolinensis]